MCCVTPALVVALWLVQRSVRMLDAAAIASVVASVVFSRWWSRRELFAAQFATVSENSMAAA